MPLGVPNFYSRSVFFLNLLVKKEQDVTLWFLKSCINKRSVEFNK